MRASTLAHSFLLATDQAEEMFFSGDCGFAFMTDLGFGAYLRLDVLPLLCKSLGFPEGLFHSPLRNRARLGLSRSLLEETAQQPHVRSVVSLYHEINDQLVLLFGYELADARLDLVPRSDTTEDDVGPAASDRRKDLGVST